MRTIPTSPNNPTLPRLEELPVEATTVIDGMDRSPQLQAVNGMLRKEPDKLVHSEADRQAISRAQQQRGKAGIMGKQWG